MQFSPAIYRTGAIPSPSIEDLAALVLEFAASKDLGNALSTNAVSNGVLGAAAEFHAGDDFIVVWYVSDGRNIMLATYVCDWDSKHIEALQREAIVRSIQF